MDKECFHVVKTNYCRSVLWILLNGGLLSVKSNYNKDKMTGTIDLEPIWNTLLTLKHEAFVSMFCTYKQFMHDTFLKKGF